MHAWLRMKRNESSTCYWMQTRRKQHKHIQFQEDAIGHCVVVVAAAAYAFDSARRQIRHKGCDKEYKKISIGFSFFDLLDDFLFRLPKPRQQQRHNTDRITYLQPNPILLLAFFYRNWTNTEWALSELRNCISNKRLESFQITWNLWSCRYLQRQLFFLFSSKVFC